MRRSIVLAASARGAAFTGSVKTKNAGAIFLARGLVNRVWTQCWRGCGLARLPRPRSPAPRSIFGRNEARCGYSEDWAPSSGG